MRWKAALKLVVVLAPAVVLVLGIVLKIGWLAGAGVVAYVLVLLTALLLRVSGNPRAGYGVHIQFRQGHQAAIQHITRRQDRDER